jgi:hypothetical protein
MYMMSGAATSKSESNWTGKAGIAAHFRCSIRHIGNQMRSRRIPYVKLGRIVRFNIPDCERAIKVFEVKCVGDFQSFSE